MASVLSTVPALISEANLSAGLRTLINPLVLGAEKNATIQSVRIASSRLKGRRIRQSSCCSAAGDKGSADAEPEYLGHDYYRVLGVSVGSSVAEIRRAYWAKQKKYHPDVVGIQGHEMALLLNEAYNTLMDGRRRAAYEQQWRNADVAGFSGFTGQPASAWNGPDWSQGIFVDEAACVGCQECTFVAPQTFTLDPNTAKARVKVQWGNEQAHIKVAVDSCPVDCIHYVEREDLAALEFLMQPRQRPCNGVFGGGWERPERGSVFQAARNFRRKLKQQEADAARTRAAEWKDEESPSQRAAREAADRKIKKEPWSWLWMWGTQPGGKTSETKAKASRGSYKEGGLPWQRMFSTAGTDVLWTMPVKAGEVGQVRVFVQEWAAMWSAASELPLPTPFRTDFVSEGVHLTFISAGNGHITSLGSLLITVDLEPGTVPLDESSLSETELVALGGPKDAVDSNYDFPADWELCVKRQGAANTGPLPGEARLIRHLKDSLAKRNGTRGYQKYHLPRKL